jgi:hypothetical protein
LQELEQPAPSSLRDEGISERLVSLLQSLQPAVRQLDQSQQQAVIAEYTYVKERLAGPSFTTPAPQITRVEATADKIRIFGIHLRGVKAVNIGGARVPRKRFRFLDSDQPCIEVDVSPGVSAGTITILTAGGAATSHFFVEQANRTRRSRRSVAEPRTATSSTGRGDEPPALPANPEQSR